MSVVSRKRRCSLVLSEPVGKYARVARKTRLEQQEQDSHGTIGAFQKENKSDPRTQDAKAVSETECQKEEEQKPDEPETETETETCVGCDKVLPMNQLDSCQHVHVDEIEPVQLYVCRESKKCRQKAETAVTEYLREHRLFEFDPTHPLIALNPIHWVVRRTSGDIERDWCISHAAQCRDPATQELVTCLALTCERLELVKYIPLQEFTDTADVNKKRLQLLAKTCSNIEWVPVMRNGFDAANMVQCCRSFARWHHALISS